MPPKLLFRDVKMNFFFWGEGTAPSPAPHHLGVSPPSEIINTPLEQYIVSEVQRDIACKLPIFHTTPVFGVPAGVTPLGISRRGLVKKNWNNGATYGGKNVLEYTSVTDRQTDGHSMTA